MNKLNPLFEAMSEIDDNIISESLKAKKRPIRMKALLIAAAVTATALFAGFAYVEKYGVYIGDDFIFGYDLYAQDDMLLPSIEEMARWGAVELGDASQGVSGVPGAGYHYHFKKSTLPSDLFEKFNIHPLINDNFTEEITDVYANAWLNTTGKNIQTQNIMFTYKLTDKETGIPVEFDITCFYPNSIQEPGYTTSFYSYDGLHYEKTKLNNGSYAFVTDYEWGDGMQSTAHFIYNGSPYNLTADIDMEGMKGILDRLGVL